LFESGSPYLDGDLPGGVVGGVARLLSAVPERQMMAAPAVQG
jgi:hypothetical protein